MRVHSVVVSLLVASASLAASAADDLRARAVAGNAPTVLRQEVAAVTYPVAYPVALRGDSGTQAGLSREAVANNGARQDDGAAAESNPLLMLLTIAALIAYVIGRRSVDRS